MYNPLVSIIIPVYNGSNYVSEAIDSALAQTYENIEIIVVNDGSKDDGATEKIVLSYGDKVKYIAKENGGVSSALNLGIANMKGEYFSWLSHDDLYEPEKVEKQINAITSNNDIVLCSGRLADENKNNIPYYTKKINKNLNGRELFNEFLHGYALNGLGFLIPISVFDNVGKFDESMRYLQDLDLWLRMMWFDYRFICQKDLLVITRVHKNQTTNTASNLFDVDREKLAKKHIDMLKNGNNKYKRELVKFYLFLFIKGKNKKGIELTKKELKNIDGHNIDIVLYSIIYFIEGTFKRICRKIYNILLKIIGKRS